MALAQLKTASFDIRDSLGYLLGNVRQEWITAVEKELKPFDLTAAQYIVLLKVGSGSATTPVEICRVLQYDTGAMTRLIDRIEAKGLIKRVAHGGDRRCVALELTAQGEELYPRLIRVLMDMNKRALRGFTKDEVAALDRLLKRVALNVAS
jgi:DNA-binding MarR family transcriptional regulator